MGLNVALRAHSEVSARDRWTPLSLAVVQRGAYMSALRLSNTDGTSRYSGRRITLVRSKGAFSFPDEKTHDKRATCKDKANI